MKSVLLAVLCSVFLLNVGCNTSGINKYTNAELPPSEPGKCYAKCLLPALAGMDTLAYLPIYTGDAPETVEMAEFIVRKEGKTTKWEKVPRDGCQSSRKEDCLVWCLKEVPISKIAVIYVADTLNTKEYELQAVVQPILNEEGKTGWKEVLCEHDVQPETYQFIGQKLLEKGYLSDAQLLKSKGRFSKEIKVALTNLQKDKNLPVGQLDVETLSFLGYNY